VPKVNNDGYASLPPGPGLGAEMNEKALLKHPPRDWIPESFRLDGSAADW